MKDLRKRRRILALLALRIRSQRLDPDILTRRYRGHLVVDHHVKPEHAVQLLIRGLPVPVIALMVKDGRMSTGEVRLLSRGELPWEWMLQQGQG